MEKGRDEVSGSGDSPCLIYIRQGPNKLLVYIDNFKGNNTSKMGMVSPNANSNANNVFNVGSDGNLNSNNANNAGGVRPAISLKY